MKHAEGLPESSSQVRCATPDIRGHWLQLQKQPAGLDLRGTGDRENPFKAVPSKREGKSEWNSNLLHKYFDSSH